jgi:hypothetical protein
MYFPYTLIPANGNAAPQTAKEKAGQKMTGLYSFSCVGIHIRHKYIQSGLCRPRIMNNLCTCMPFLYHIFRSSQHDLTGFRHNYAIFTCFIRNNFSIFKFIDKTKKCLYTKGTLKDGMI